MSGLRPKCVRFVRIAASGLSGLPIGNRTDGRKRTLGLSGVLLPMREASDTHPA